MNTPLNQTRFRVQGMDCASCAAKIDTAARRIIGVEDVSVSFTGGTMTVRHAPDSDLAALEKRVTGLGYSITAFNSNGSSPPSGGAVPAHAHDHDHDHHDHAGQQHAKDAAAALHGHDHGPATGSWWKSQKYRLTIASGLALVMAYTVGILLPQVEPYVFIAAMLVGLLPIARRAVMAAVNGTPFSIEMLMTIAAIGAVFIDASEEAAVVVFLFLVGEMLEGVAAGRARASIKALTQLVPKTALLEKDGQTDEVQAESLSAGVVILVRPGDRISADGVIVSGESSINEAPVTGESTPIRKGKEAAVFAGTINGEGALKIRVTATAADNTIARVVKLVEEAQESKAPTERFIDRFSRYYTPGVVAAAALVAVLPPLLLGGVWSVWIYRGLAILLIGCPCALVISTPAAIASALSAGARRGLLMKGGAVLESLGSINAMALDKTGTLTEGRPRVTDVVPLARRKAEMLSLAAALETGSNHPLARAILDRAKEQEVQVPSAEDASAIGGKGVTGKVGGEAIFLGSPAAAQERAAFTAEHKQQIEAFHGAGKSVAVLVAGNEVAGIFAMRDEPRADAKAGLDALKAAGVELVMLTGDNRRTAEAIGFSLGLPVHAELLPEDKQNIVRDMQRRGKKVAKVGDGINDAPALAAADVGIAMGGGTDVALETADAAVLHGRVLDLARMVALSRLTMRNIHQNIALALGLKAVFLVTTVLGYTGLWPAILADTGATVLVTGNAMLLLRWQGRA
jgi:Cd2+/Zn2+-exporting ATPase